MPKVLIAAATVKIYNDHTYRIEAGTNFDSLDDMESKFNTVIFDDNIHYPNKTDDVLDRTQPGCEEARFKYLLSAVNALLARLIWKAVRADK